MPNSQETSAMLTESLQDAIDEAFKMIPGDPEREGLARAEVTKIELEKGGFVGITQYKVTLATLPH